VAHFLTLRLAGKMRIEPLDLTDEKTVRACYDVMLAAHQVDEAVEPPMSYGLFLLYLRKGWEHTPTEAWVALDDSDVVVGYGRLELPDLENLDRANGGPTVTPAMRRRGIGREMLRWLAARATANGRTVFSSDVPGGSAGEAFAQATGARPELEEVRRIQHLRKIAPGTVATLRASAEAAAAGYSLVTWTGPVPDRYLGPMAEVLNAFADAPHGENVEPEVWDAARVRERTSTAQRAGLLRGYSVAAVHELTGELAAYTEVVVDPEAPQWGFQQLTAVTRAHRGHRLGLLAKTHMLAELAGAEPQLEFISTSNAAANSYMIAVNEMLGYEVVDPCWRFFEIPVADIG
jgi:GNAT superfamily N-acetyltransferase